MTMDGDITILPLTRDLIDACWSLRLRALREHPDAFGQPYESAACLTPEQVRNNAETRWMAGDNRVFLAQAEDGDLVGMIGIVREPVPKMAHRMVIWGVYTVPEARGRGVSTALHHAAIAHARATPGVRMITLQVVTSNAGAVRTYERAGFVRYGHLPMADIGPDGPLDSDFMVLMLD